MLKVNAGDIVTANAFGKYIDKTSSNTFSVDDLVGLLASAFGYTAGSVETGIQYSGVDNGMGLLGLLVPLQREGTAGRTGARLARLRGKDVRRGRGKVAYGGSIGRFNEKMESVQLCFR
jgi:hypothetical protein